MTGPVQLIGPYADLFRAFMNGSPPPEISMEGPAGTGKTFFYGTLLSELHTRHPRLRSLVLRKVRIDLAESFLQVLEDDVLGPGHPVLKGPSRENRRKYTWPNGSETMIGGMDKISRTYSTQFDLVFFNEGIEFLEDEYEGMYRAMRNDGVPWKSMLVDTNPGAEHHWLNKRPNRAGSRMQRIITRHRHNPALFDPRTKTWTRRGVQYIQTLRQYTGYRRKRMYEGLWVASEGVIYEHWDPDVHVIRGGPRTKEKPFGVNLPDFEYLIAGIDVGFRDAVVFQLWGVDRHRRMFRVHERYGVGVTFEKLADWVVGAYTNWGFVACVCDHDPKVITYLNERLGWRAGRDVGSLVRPARKGSGSVLAGIDLMRDLLGEPAAGVAPRMFFVQEGRCEPDPQLSQENMPTCTEAEFPAYTWAETKDGKRVVNEPDPNCVDHGLDTSRYVASEVWGTDYSVDPEVVGYPKGTMGEAAGHNEIDEDEDSDWPNPW